MIGRMTGWQRFLLFLPVPGALGFGLGPLLLCCALAPADGSAQPVVALIVANSILELAVCCWLLFRLQNIAPGVPNIPTSGVALVIIATAAALVTGLPALALPLAVGHLPGYHLTDVIILRLAGAATLGYAVMGALEMRSRDWTEMQLPVPMAMVFNGAGLLATVAGFIEGGPTLLRRLPACEPTATGRRVAPARHYRACRDARCRGRHCRVPSRVRALGQQKQPPRFFRGSSERCSTSSELSWPASEVARLDVSIGRPQKYRSDCCFPALADRSISASRWLSICRHGKVAGR